MTTPHTPTAPLAARSAQDEPPSPHTAPDTPADNTPSDDTTSLARRLATFLWPLGWILLALQLGFSALAIATGVLHGTPGQHLVGFLLGAVAATINWLLLNLLLQRLRWLRLAANLLHFTLAALFLVNLLTAKRSADFMFIAENIKGFLYIEGLEVLGGYFAEMLHQPVAQLGLLVYLATIGGAIFAEVRWRTITRHHLPHRWRITAALSALLGVLIIAPIPAYDEVLLLERDALRATMPIGLSAAEARAAVAHNGTAPAPPTDTTHPMIHTITTGPLATEGSPWRPADAPKPPVILVMVESFNGLYVEGSTPEGTPYMPFLREKLKEGVYVPNMHGTSIKTSKGQFSAITGLLPKLRGIALEKYPHNHYKTLFHFMRDAGYQTSFLQAYADLRFEGSWAICHNGVDLCAAEADLMRPEDAPEIWGWGATDALFYRRALDRLEQQLATDDRPPFTVLATISNHAPFFVPKERRKVYPEAQTMEQHFANSIRMSDEGLASLFDELQKRPKLRDAVVIVTGDHSSSTGRAGLSHQHMGYYENLFRVPLLIWWPGHLPPRRVEHQASLVDIPSTVLHLLGIPAKRHHFQGDSLLRDDLPRDRPVYLVQPYDGLYLSVIRWPYKYVANFRDARDSRVHDLSKDPDETHPLPLDTLPVDLLARFEADVLRARVNEHAINTNTVWDQPNPEAKGKKRPKEARRLKLKKSERSH